MLFIHSREEKGFWPSFKRKALGWVMCTIVGSLFCTPGTNIPQYVNYTGIIIKKTWKVSHFCLYFIGWDVVIWLTLLFQGTLSNVEIKHLGILLQDTQNKFTFEWYFHFKYRYSEHFSLQTIRNLLPSLCHKFCNKF